MDGATILITTNICIAVNRLESKLSSLTHGLISRHNYIALSRPLKCHSRVNLKAWLHCPTVTPLKPVQSIRLPTTVVFVMNRIVKVFLASLPSLAHVVPWSIKSVMEGVINISRQVYTVTDFNLPMQSTGLCWISGTRKNQAVPMSMALRPSGTTWNSDHMHSGWNM